jgi:hypothetical protein
MEIPWEEAVKKLIEQARAGEINQRQFKVNVGKQSRRYVAHMAGYRTWRELVDGLWPRPHKKPPESPES